jgi:hypothetical protein
MLHNTVRTNDAWRQSTFALLVVLAFAHPPAGAAQDDLGTFLQKLQTAAQIEDYRKSIENNTAPNPNAGKQAVDDFHKNTASEAKLIGKEPGEPSRTQTALSNATRGFISDPNVYGSIVRLMTAKDVMKSFKTLSPQEDQGPWLGAPSVPAGCVEPSAAALSANPRAKECGECFARAQAELDTVRRRFDRLQLIYLSGIAHINALIAYGESVRNVSPFAYAATREQAASLLADANHVRASYDQSYDRLLQQLKTALDHISECEDRAFGNDWYNRYGFVLYQSFAMHYRRTN